MSYILDALRKSETERQQGKVPDLGQQVQLIHRPKRKSVPTGIWLGLILTLNTAVLAYVFWPGRQATSFASGVAQDQTVEQDAITASAAEGQVAASEPMALERQSMPEPVSESITAIEATASQSENLEPVSVAEASTDEPDLNELPTVIVPSTTRFKPLADPDYSDNVEGDGERVPHLVELPMSFQKTVPDLTFNSHVYASDPVARRVMINDHYLRIGESFDGIRVERITEEGVVLSKAGTRFRVGVVRDWKSPR